MLLPICCYNVHVHGVLIARILQWAAIPSSRDGLMLSNCDAREDSWQSLGQQGDQPVNPKGNEPWIFLGKTDAEAEAPILRSPDVKSQLIGKDCDAGKDWRQKEKKEAEDELVGWHHQCKGCEFGQAPDGEGQRSLGCCSSWGCKKSDMTWLPNSNNNLLPQHLVNTSATAVMPFVHVCMCSVISDSLQPRTVAHQALLSMGFSRPEYWSGLPFSPPGDFPDTGIEPTSQLSPYIIAVCQCDLLLYQTMRSGRAGESALNLSHQTHSLALRGY